MRFCTFTRELSTLIDEFLAIDLTHPILVATNASIYAIVSKKIKVAKQAIKARGFMVGHHFDMIDYLSDVVITTTIDVPNAGEHFKNVLIALRNKDQSFFTKPEHTRDLLRALNNGIIFFEEADLKIYIEALNERQK